MTTQGIGEQPGFIVFIEKIEFGMLVARLLSKNSRADDYQKEA
jgi:hypothetical protein